MAQTRRILFYSENKLKLTLYSICLPWIFIGLAATVSKGGTNAFDEILFETFKAWKQGPLGAQWLVEVARDVTALGSITVLSIITLSVAGFFLVRRNFSLSGFLMISVLGVFGFNSLLKELFDRARPNMDERLTHVFTSSFPSAHAMNSAAVFLLLGAVLAHYQNTQACKLYVLCMALTLTFGVGISRVYLGVHWPTDVLGGWAAGAFWALLSCLVGYAWSHHFETGKSSPH